MRRSSRVVGLLALVLACGDQTGDEGSTIDTETTAAPGDGDPSTGDGDPTTGDGDGDPTTGDGDGDPTTGDGDGDPSTGDGDGDPTTGDGDGDGCDPNAFTGVGIADDPWMQGSYCDSVFVCADAQVAQDLMAVLNGVQCLPNEPFCADLRCQIAQGNVTATTVDDACTALTVAGIDEVYCVVYGP